MAASMAVLMVVLLPSFVLTNGQMPRWGPCPEPTTQAGFKLQQFMGRWFEIAKLPLQFEKGRCIETNFTLNSDSSVKVVSSEILKGELKRIVGVGVTEDLKNPAKLGITYSYVLPYAPYWILATDYVNSAVLYSCTDILRLFHVDSAWVFSRTRTLPAATLAKATEIYTKNNIDVSKMVATRQDNCCKAV